MRQYDYKCSRCDKETERDLLTVKNIRFLEIGEKPKQLRSRNVGWLCPECVASDPDWNRASHTARNPNPTRVSRGAAPRVREDMYDSPDLESALQMGSQWQKESADS